MHLRLAFSLQNQKCKKQSSCEGDLTMEIIEVVKKLEKSGFMRIQSEEQVRVMSDFVNEFKKDMRLLFYQVVFAVCGFIVIYADISPKLSGLLKLFAN